MRSELFPTLRDITFAERDSATIERELIRGYENAYQLQFGQERKLYPGDPIRLFLETIAFALIHQRQLIDYTGKMNLLAYSRGDYLDHLGALLGVYRLPAQSALTTLKFTLSAPQIGASVIPAGTRATPGGGDIIFATAETATIQEGTREVEASAYCMVTGAHGNGFLPGQIRKIVDPFPWQMSVENMTISYGGTDTEIDENFRERIQLAPEYFSVAGPSGAYEYWARTAHQGIIDVAVIGPPEIEPGNVEIYPLMIGGELPTQDILDAVYNICSADDVRPLTDYVFVKTPQQINYNLQVTYWINRRQATSAAAIQQTVEQSVQSWISWQRSKLGRDLNPSELNYRMIASGAKRVEIGYPLFTVLTQSQVAVPGNVNVVFGGLEDG
jgi:phage-related baseplate assembly protein